MITDILEESKEGVVSDAFLNLENVKPSYEQDLEGGKEVETAAVELKLNLPKKEDKEAKEDDDDEFERDEEYGGDENANADEEEKSATFEKGKDNKVKLKVNINVTNLKPSKPV